MTQYEEKRQTEEALKKAQVVLSNERGVESLKEVYNILLYRRDCVAEYAGDKSKRPSRKYLAKQYDELTEVMKVIEKMIDVNYKKENNMEERITITLHDLGDITATKDTFNELAIAFYYAKKQYKMEECFALAKKVQRKLASLSIQN